MEYKTDYKRVAGLGSAKKGVDHWISIRVTGIALIVLGVLFLYTFVGQIGGSYEDVLAKYQHPVPALIAIMFFLTMFRHLRLGMEEVIVDYVSDHRAQMRVLILNTLVWRAVAIVGIFAVAKIALGA